MLLQDKRDAILSLAAARGAHNVRVYGTAARAVVRKIKAVDFVVELEEGRTMLDVGLLAMDLRELLGLKVYVVPEGELRPRVREKVVKEAVAI